MREKREEEKKNPSTHFFLEIETSELLDNAKHAFNIRTVSHGEVIYTNTCSVGVQKTTQNGNAARKRDAASFDYSLDAKRHN